MYAILTTSHFHDQAQQLAQRLNLPLHAQKSKDAFFYLYYDEKGLSLTSTHLNLGPLHLDFNHGALHQRLQRAAISKEPLARAVGLHKQSNLRICDATAGIGREGSLLAFLGAEVTLVERSPMMIALLTDALLRCTDPKIERVKLIAADSCDFLSSTKEQFDVIYLDPMFEEHSHKALVKKEMQYLQALMGPAEDADELFSIALSLKPWRVVVKRPLKARSLLNKKPDFCLSLAAYRFDIYL